MRLDHVVSGVQKIDIQTGNEATSRTGEMQDGGKMTTAATTTNTAVLAVMTAMSQTERTNVMMTETEIESLATMTGIETGDAMTRTVIGVGTGAGIETERAKRAASWTTSINTMSKVKNITRRSHRS